MILPQDEKICSSSSWVREPGRPLMYRLASLMLSLLGRANDTYTHAQDGPLLNMGAG